MQNNSPSPVSSASNSDTEYFPKSNHIKCVFIESISFFHSTPARIQNTCEREKSMVGWCHVTYHTPHRAALFKRERRVQKPDSISGKKKAENKICEFISVFVWFGLLDIWKVERKIKHGMNGKDEENCTVFANPLRNNRIYGMIWCQCVWLGVCVWPSCAV